MQTKTELLIIGGGISGLAAAFCAQRDGKDFLLLEASNRLGGCIWTDLHQQKYILERGPNSLAIGSYTQELVSILGLTLLKPNPKAKNKLVYANKKLHSVSNPIYLFGSNFLSWKAKLSLFKSFEPKWKNNSDENIEEFFNYCFSKEITNNLVWPLLNGIYAGHPGTLSIKSVFPTIFEIAQNNNNLILGFIKKLFKREKATDDSTNKKNRPKKRKKEIVSFSGGLNSLVQAIQKFLTPDKIKLNSPIKRLYIEEGHPVVELADSQIVKAKKVILALPAYKVAEIAPEAYGNLSELRYAPIAAVNLICNKDFFSSEALNTINSSFGFLTARNQDLQVLGIIFSSSLFSNRSPEDKLAFTCFVGGINNPEALHLSDLEITDLCLRDIKKVFHLSSLKEEFSIVTKWQQGIPQYEIGHQKLIKENLSKLPGVVLAGNYLRGLSIEDTVKSGFEAYEEASRLANPNKE